MGQAKKDADSRQVEKYIKVLDLGGRGDLQAHEGRTHQLNAQVP